MPARRPATIEDYVDAAPVDSRAHLHALHSILEDVAPNAKQVLKWGNPFFVDPRFLYAYSAHKAHLSFAPGLAAMEAFSEELKAHPTTKNFLKIPYSEPVPEELIRKMAEFCLHALNQREDDSFW